MRILNLNMKNFTSFKSMNLNFVKGINIISGDNATGKSNILKILYCIIKSLDDIYKTNSSNLGKITKEKTIEIVSNKISKLFMPESIGHLVHQNNSSKHARVELGFENVQNVEISFSRKALKRVEMPVDFRNSALSEIKPVYLPPKEIISVHNFRAIYEIYNIAFEETYYDLAKILHAPLRKQTEFHPEQKQLIEKFEKIIQGKVYFNNDRFFLKIKDAGTFEMGLTAEGFRKIATILQLLSNDTLTSKSILFWDELEANTNPKMIRPIVNCLLELAAMGVQIFVCTHSYFIQREFSLISEYKATKNNIDIQFLSLYKEDGTVFFESGSRLSDLGHNCIMDEFDALYNREQDLFYAD